MSTLRNLLHEHTDLEPADIEHLHVLASDWQLVSDLSFADLLMWVPAGGEQEFLCVAQVRPTTAPTAYQEDQVGRLVSGQEAAHLAIARSQLRIWREGDPVWLGDTPSRHEAIPVRRSDSPDVIAVLGRDTNLLSARTPSQLELNYLTTADDLAQMITDGAFPVRGPKGESGEAPRVGDGLIRIDEHGKVTYATPNAHSAYRRLGVTTNLAGEDLAAVTRRLPEDEIEGAEIAEHIVMALRGESPPRTEVEARGATVLLRALPLMPAKVPIGALVLVHDVTEVRRRDRQLVTKDATIREIHHRVKNNLQTVAALLRLQARRVESPAAKVALEESVRRIASIALVHETLSMSSDEAVEFDKIVDQVIASTREVASPESRIRMRRTGTFGILAGEIATPLVMVLNELLQNAVEHAFPPGSTGEVIVSAHRFRKQLHVCVADDGNGLPEGFAVGAGDRLGLQIVQALATGALAGSIELTARTGGGTEAMIVVPLVRR